MKYTLKPHQKAALAKMHNGCVLWGGVGTGKTITSLAYANEYEPGRPIVVVTTAKVRDSLSWEKTAARMAVPFDLIEVTSWNKIQSFTDREGCLFIFDEQKVVGSGAWVKAFHKIAKKNRWILLSGTPGDSWADYSALFIANGWYKNITEYRRQHAVYSRFTNYPKIEKWVNEPLLLKHRKNLLVHMPMERHTTRHINYVHCEYDEELMDIVRKRRWNIYEDKPIENPSELFGVMRKVVSTDPSRRSALEYLVQKHPKLIVFYNYNYELDILREICSEAVDEYRQLEMVSPSQSMTSSSSTSTTDTSSDDTQKISQENSTSPSNSSRINHTSPEEKTESCLPTVSMHSSPETTTARSTASPQLTPSSLTTTSSLPASSRTSRTSSPASPWTKSKSDVVLPERTARTDARSSSSSRQLPRTDSTTSTPRSVSTTMAESTTASPSPRRSEWSPTAQDTTSKSQFFSEKMRDLPSDSGVGDTITLRPPSEEQHGTRSTRLSQIPSSSGTSTPTSLCTPGTSSSISPTSSSSSAFDLTGVRKSDTDPKTSNLSFGWAEWNGHKHQPVPETDRWIYLVQYQSGSEGWNCTETDAMAFWSLTYSWKQYEQGQGRIDRLDTPFRDLNYYVLLADSPAEKPVIASLNAKKDFQPR